MICPMSEKLAGLSSGLACWYRSCLALSRRAWPCLVLPCLAIHVTKIMQALDRSAAQYVASATENRDHSDRKPPGIVICHSSHLETVHYFSLSLSLSLSLCVSLSLVRSLICGVPNVSAAATATASP